MGEEEKKPGEEYRYWKAPETGGQTKPEAKYVIGATERPDGSLDLSQAAEFLDPKKNAELRIQSQQRREQEKKKAFEIPPGVERGSTRMVKHELGKKIFVVQEALDKARASGSSTEIERRSSRVKILQKEQQLLDEAIHSLVLMRAPLSTERASEIIDDNIETWETSEKPDIYKEDLVAARELASLLAEESSKGKSKLQFKFYSL